MLFLANGVRVCFQVIPSSRQQVTELTMVDSNTLICSRIADPCR